MAASFTWDGQRVQRFGPLLLSLEACYIKYYNPKKQTLVCFLQMNPHLFNRQKGFEALFEWLWMVFTFIDLVQVKYCWYVLVLGILLAVTKCCCGPWDWLVTTVHPPPSSCTSSASSRSSSHGSLTLLLPHPTHSSDATATSQIWRNFPEISLIACALNSCMLQQQVIFRNSRKMIWF